MWGADPHQAALPCSSAGPPSCFLGGTSWHGAVRSSSEPRSVPEQSDPEPRVWRATLDFVPGIYLAPLTSRDITDLTPTFSQANAKQHSQGSWGFLFNVFII